MCPLHPHPVRAGARAHPTLWVVAAGLVCAVWLRGSFMMQEPRYFPGPFSPAPEIPPLEVPLHFAKPLDLDKATDLLVEVVVQLESQGDANLVGSIGERGLMQIRPETWAEVTRRHFGEEIPFDRAFEPLLNRQVGRLYLGDLQKFLYPHQSHWKADLRSLLLAAYNAGPDRIKQAGFDLRRLPAKTRDYAQRGSALHDWFLKNQAGAFHQLLKENLPTEDP